MALVNIFIFPEWPGFLNLHPHPFFALVILISLRYSRIESTISTLMICFSLWFLTIVYPENVDQTSRTIVIDKMVLLFITNLILGEFGSLLNREVLQTKDKLKTIVAEHDALKTRYNAIAAVKEELSERIVGQTSSVVSLYEASKSLDVTELEDLQKALLQLAVKFVGVKKVSLYWREGNERKLTFNSAIGWSEEELNSAKDEVVPFGKGPVGFAAERGRMYSLHQLQKLDEYEQMMSETSNPSILVAPLNVGGHVVGVINVEELPFLKFTPTSVRLFFLIIDLGSSAISKNRRFAALEELSVIEPDSGLHASIYFERRLVSELQRFSRAGAPFVYLLMKIDNFPTFAEKLGKGMVRFEREITGHIFTQKRDLDIISATDEDGIYRMLLPATDIEGAISFISKLGKAIFHRIKVRTRGEVIPVSASFICFEVSTDVKGETEFAAKVLNMNKRLQTCAPGTVIVGESEITI